MKSRRRIACPQGPNCATWILQLQQGFAISEMGFRGYVAEQHCRAADVCFGSKADITSVEPMSAITPKATAKADMDRPGDGTNDHARSVGMSAFLVAIGGKADMGPATEKVANDPKRTLAARICCAAPCIVSMLG
jgi:hypothetical protein